jgi:hypothetical protein
MIAKFPQDIQDFANVFLTLQQKRHIADYDPVAKFFKSSVTADIDQAEAAINVFKTVNVKDRRAFCAYVLLRERNV